MLARTFVALQYLLPRHWLTAVIYSLARVRNVRIKDFLITQFVHAYDVDVDDVKLDFPQDFPTFNDFFVRELNDGARSIDPGADSIVSPVDGTVSIAGSLRGGSLLQAKGLATRSTTCSRRISRNRRPTATVISRRFTSRPTTTTAYTRRLTVNWSRHVTYRAIFSASTKPRRPRSPGCFVAMSDSSCISGRRTVRRCWFSLAL